MEKASRTLSGMSDSLESGSSSDDSSTSDSDTDLEEKATSSTSNTFNSSPTVDLKSVNKEKKTNNRRTGSTLTFFSSK